MEKSQNYTLCLTIELTVHILRYKSISKKVVFLGVPESKPCVDLETYHPYLQICCIHHRHHGHWEGSIKMEELLSILHHWKQQPHSHTCRFSGELVLHHFVLLFQQPPNLLLVDKIVCCEHAAFKAHRNNLTLDFMVHYNYILNSVLSPQTINKKRNAVLA